MKHIFSDMAYTSQGAARYGTNHSSFVFVRPRIRISDRKLILVMVLCNFPQYFHGNIDLGHSNFLQIHQSHNDINIRITPTNAAGKASLHTL